MRGSFVLSLLVAASQQYDCTDFDSFDLNMQPIIGIVSQPLADDMVNDLRFVGTDSYIMAAYVKFMEAAGARVVPLIWNEDWSITLSKLQKINGVLFPGGAGDYVDYGRAIIDQLQTFNDSGQFYPAWGTCLGFENMLIWASDAGHSVLSKYYAEDSLTLDFVVPPENTEMFKDLGAQAYKFEETPMTLNSHHYSVDPDLFTTDASLAAFYKLTSVSYTPAEGDPFGASMEAYNYPFFGTQFHPEKPMTMFNDGTGINHTWESITLNRYFADKFLSYARQNTNYWGDFTTVQGVVIENCRFIVMDDYYGEVYAFSSTEGCIP